MLEEVKSQLLDNPESIQHILETFGFDHIRMRNNEIRCAFEHGCNPTAIVIRLRDNDNLFVKDYERNLNYDLLTYITKAKNIAYRDVLNEVKKELGITSLCNFRRQVGLFGGLYSNIAKPNRDVEIKTYPEEVLQQYESIPNLRWLRDGIPLRIQRKWGVGYDHESQRITLPIRTPTGEIMAIKGRANYEISEYEPKYLALCCGPISQTLFGFSENFCSLYESDLWIFESEKSILRLDAHGYNNAVALGNNSLSATQAKLIMSLNPKSVTFMLDKGLPLENTMRNVEVLRSFCQMRDLEIRYWNWEWNLDLDDKCAPVDGSIEEFKYILENEIVTIQN